MNTAAFATGFAIYGYELESARVVALAQKAIPLFEEIRRAVMAFCDWLEDSKL